MSLPIILRPQAETDIEDAYEWYEEQRPGLGAEFLQALDAVVDLIARQPELFPPRSRGARRAPLRRFPYGIIYVM